MSSQGGGIPAYITRAVKSSLRVAAWPLSNHWLTRTLERALYYNLKLQSVSYYWLSASRPHFPNSRESFYTAYLDRDPFRLIRGFHTRRVIPAGGKVLTIGCGDGFNDYFFLSTRAGHIDAVDVEPEAIHTARRIHRAPNIHYHNLNAVQDPFPGSNYDVVVMDGCVAHFRPEDLRLLMGKIDAVTHEKSLFIGSEVMESEDQMTHDHFIAFPTTAAMETFLSEHWPKVHVWREDGPRYSQAFFRCAKSDLGFQRLEQDTSDNLRRVLS
jgi:SAM-dependent methyltransferase